MEKWKQHLGVYGIYIKDWKLLVVNKTRGPYKNRFDLPGGSFDQNESITECLIRELNEEIGYRFDANNLIGTYDYLVPWVQEGGYTHVHHLAIYFEVVTEDEVLSNKIVADDTSGFEFVAVELLNADNSSPLVQDIVMHLKGLKMLNSIKRFDDWKVLQRKAILL